MRWLQWSTIDLEHGLGGVEVHARCVARELGKLGIETAFSRDPAAWRDSRWDVIHTHGSAIGLMSLPAKREGAIHLHTLHGTTLGRMAACREWKWVGGYHAFAREIYAVQRADVVAAVHPGLSLLRLAKRLKKVTTVCMNGWDSSLENESAKLPAALAARLEAVAPYFVYVGRGSDRVKGADFLCEALRVGPAFHLVAAPGEGFESVSEVIRTGVLSPAQVRRLMAGAQAMISPSRYEGNSLAVAEALARGLPVITTAVGAAPILPREIQGLIVLRSAEPAEIHRGIREALSLSVSSEARHLRAVKNQQHLPRWEKVAHDCLHAVKAFQNRG